MVDKTAPSLVRKDIHDVERVVQRYKRKPLDQQAYQAVTPCSHRHYRQLQYECRPRNSLHLFNCPVKHSPFSPEDPWLQLGPDCNKTKQARAAIAKLSKTNCTCSPEYIYVSRLTRTIIPRVLDSSQKSQHRRMAINYSSSQHPEDKYCNS